MRSIYPDRELIASGSSSSPAPTSGTWGATVLVEAYEQVDFISARARRFEADGTWPASRAPCAAKELTEWIHISFDERNDWYQDAAPSALPRAGRSRRSRRSCSRTTTTTPTPETR